MLPCSGRSATGHADSGSPARIVQNESAALDSETPPCAPDPAGFSRCGEFLPRTIDLIEHMALVARVLFGHALALGGGRLNFLAVLLLLQFTLAYGIAQLIT